MRKWLMVLALPVAACGQGMVEYGAAAGRSATMSAPAKGVGSALGAAFEKLNRSLDGSKASDGRTSADVRPATAKPAAPGKAPAVETGKHTFEDPGEIRSGIAYDELLRRFGPPALESTGADGLRSLRYETKERSVEVAIRAGKVASFETFGHPPLAGGLTVTR